MSETTENIAEVDRVVTDDPSPILSAAFVSALVAAVEAEQQAFRSDNMSNPPTPMQSPGVSSMSKSLYSSTDPGTNHALGMLATKWMDSKHVAQHVRETGITPVSGKFSDAEIACLDASIGKYAADHHLSDDDVREIVLHKGKNTKHQPFWRNISAAVEGRPMKHVRMHLQRRYNPTKQQGKWHPKEDQKLIQAVAEFGQKWTQVSGRIGRTDADCRDRYRNYLADREVRNTAYEGPWSHEEENQLKRIVSEMSENGQGKTFWTEVSKRMGKCRGRLQCKEKWLTMCKSSDPGLEGESSLNAGYRVIVWDGPTEGTVPQTFLAP